MAKRTKPLTEETSTVGETPTLEEIKEEFQNLEEDFETLEKASEELLNQVEDSEVTEDETQVEIYKTVPQYFIDLGLKYCPKCCERLFTDSEDKPFCNDNLPTINCPYLRGEIV